MPKGWATPGTGYMIRDILKVLGEAYVLQLHERCKEFCRPLVTPDGLTVRPGYTPPSYKSVQNFIYVLRKLDLITLAKEVPDPAHPYRFPRRYYRLVAGKENDQAWRNPQDAWFRPDVFARKTEFRIDYLTSKDWLDRIRRLQR